MGCTATFDDQIARVRTRRPQNGQDWTVEVAAELSGKRAVRACPPERWWLWTFGGGLEADFDDCRVEVPAGVADQPEAREQAHRYGPRRVSDDGTDLARALLHQAPEQALLFPTLVVELVRLHSVQCDSRLTGNGAQGGRNGP